MIINGFGGSGGSTVGNQPRIVRGIDGSASLWFNPSVTSGSLYGSRTIAYEAYSNSHAITVGSFSIAKGASVTCNQTKTVSNGSSTYIHRYGIYKTISLSIPTEYYGVPYWVAIYLDVNTTHGSSNITIWTSTASSSVLREQNSVIFYVSRAYTYPLQNVSSSGYSTPNFVNSGYSESEYMHSLLANYKSGMYYTYGGLGTYAKVNQALSRGAVFYATDDKYLAPTFNFFCWAENGSSDAGAVVYTSAYSFTVTLKALFVQTY